MLNRIYIALIVILATSVVSCEKEAITPNRCSGDQDFEIIKDVESTITDPDEDEDYDLEDVSEDITDPDEDEDYDLEDVSDDITDPDLDNIELDILEEGNNSNKSVKNER